MPPIKFNGKYYYIRDTSSFDALLEVLVFSYKNIKNCKVLTDDIDSQQNHQNNVTQLIKKCINEKFSKYYKSRLCMLLKIAQLNEINEIEITESISIFSSKLMKGYSYYFESLTCDSCEISLLNQEEVLSISNHDNLNNFKIKDLQIYVSEYLKNRIRQITSFCTCKNVQVKQDFIGPFFMLNIHNKNVFEIREIPEILIMCEKKFVLTGIIASRINKNYEVTQYISFCRNLQGFWSEHNNLKKNAFSIKSLKGRHLKISLLIYVNIESSV